MRARVRQLLAPRLRAGCVAPHSSLYFQPDGRVKACCATGHYAGTVTGPDRESLADIWAGAELARLRAALEADDFSMGCQECEVAQATGGRGAAMAADFDAYGRGAPHTFPLVMDFALSNRCNLQCVMCNGELSSAIRRNREHRPDLAPAYDDRFFDELAPFLPHLRRATFKGGEPFLSRSNRRVWDLLLAGGHQPMVTLVTNGTIFNDDVARYVTELRMEPAISVDAMDPATLEAIRVGVDARALWANVDRFQELAEASGRRISLYFSLIRANWREVHPFLQEAERRNARANVIFVNQPDEHDVLRLPRRDLVAIHDELARQPGDFADARVAAQWTEVLRRIRAQIDHPVTLEVRTPIPLRAVQPPPVPDPIPPPTPSSPPDGASDEPAPPAVTLDDADVVRLRDALTRRSGDTTLLVTIQEGSVATVTPAPWADDLGPESWAGLALDDLRGRIEHRLGPITPSEAGPDVPAGVDRFTALGADGRGIEALWFVTSTGAPCLVLARLGPADTDP